MRIMNYRMKMEDGDKYLICNADVPWNLMPQEKNFHAPGICIQNEPFPEGHILCGQTISIDDYIEPLFLHENTVPEFRNNYLRAVYGELKGWKLIAICIEKNHIELTVGKDEDCYEILEIASAPHLRFSVEAPTFGGRTSKYLIEADMENSDGLMSRNHKAFARISVTEYEDYGKRRIIFQNNTPLDKAYVLNEWIEVIVVEYR